MESKIDLENFCIDITDPVNAELLQGFKEWLNQKLGKELEFSVTFYGYCEGIQYSGTHKWTALTTLPELQKQHPEIFEQNTVPSFKAGQEVFNNGDDVIALIFVEGNESKSVTSKRIPAKYIGRINEHCHAVSEIVGESIYKLHSTIEVTRPIPAQPTMESEIENILAKINGRTYTDKDATHDILAWHQKHSGRVEVSVPSDKLPTMEESEREMKRIFGSVSDKFVLDNYYFGWRTFYRWVSGHFMTRKEANG